MSNYIRKVGVAAAVQVRPNTAIGAGSGAAIGAVLGGLLLGPFGAMLGGAIGGGAGGLIGAERDEENLRRARSL